MISSYLDNTETRGSIYSMGEVYFCGPPPTPPIESIFYHLQLIFGMRIAVHLHL